MTDQITTPAKRKYSNGNGSVPLTDILYRTLHYWPWVLLSLFVCVGAATLYLLCTPKIYTTSASLLIKDSGSNKSQSMGVGGEEFANMGLFQNKTNIQNEMTSLMSSDLMDEVVKRLKLDVNYYIPGTFHNEIAYGDNLPVNVVFADFPGSGLVRFDLVITPDSAVTISNMAIGNGDVCKTDYEGRLNDTIVTAVGPVVIMPAECFAQNTEISLKVDKIPAGWATAIYSSNLMVNLNNKDGSVVDITLTDRSMKRAQAIISTLIGVYNENWISDRNQIAVSTSNFINERLGVIERELGSVDSDISSYKSQNLVPDVNAAAAMYMSQNQETQARMLELGNQLQ
ncbi:MAG: chromosome partitioning protein ParA, partial [Muribaculaceae bacterium]|nr:chromosome partitioning protein ParA [Muribaculaceae bacterium]